MVGRKFNRLTVLAFSHKNKYGQKLWLCRCDCGNEKPIYESYIKNGATKSCGCLKKEMLRERRLVTKNTQVSKMIEMNGISLSRKDWSLRIGGHPGIVSQRIRGGWSKKRAVSIPVQKYTKKDA